VTDATDLPRAASATDATPPPTSADLDHSQEPSSPDVQVEDLAPASRDGEAPATVVEASGTTATGSNRSRTRQVVEWAVVVVLAMLIAAGLRAFVVQAFFVPTGSMVPTLQIGDRIIVVKVGYTIHRGDIVVFRRTPADVYTPDADLVKRVIGMPGETISSRGDTVLINGRPIAEPWLPPLTGPCAEPAYDIRPTKIPPDNYFVMGDCRGDSEDSRAWGTLPASYIVGKVVVIVWRFGRPYFHWF
jgi:signal peptidase I